MTTPLDLDAVERVAASATAPLDLDKLHVVNAWALMHHERIDSYDGALNIAETLLTIEDWVHNGNRYSGRPSPYSAKVVTIVDREDYVSLTAELRAARERIAGLEADAARLDWIIDNAAAIRPNLSLDNLDDEPAWSVRPAMLSSADHDDLRQAIDAARGEG